MSDPVEKDQNDNKVQMLQAGEAASDIASIAVLMYSTGRSEEVYAAVTGMGACLLGANVLAKCVVGSSTKKVSWYQIGWGVFSTGLLVSGVYILSSLSERNKKK